MDIYDHIVDGIEQHKSDPAEITQYLESLKPEVKMLRRAYRNTTVSVPYHRQPVQGAYLIAYFPHYYQLLHKILMEQQPLAEDCTSLSIVFMGAGPGPEVYGAIKFILEYMPQVTNLRIDILDINADTWKYSHKIIKAYLIKHLPEANRLRLDWNTHPFDLTKPEMLGTFTNIIVNAQLITIQNCINEIPNSSYSALKTTIDTVFEHLSDEASLLMIDLTNGSHTRQRIKALESLLCDKYPNLYLKSTLANEKATATYSIHSRPNRIIRDHLLDRSDGLIPRTNLKYDFSLLTKGLTRPERKRSEIGFEALYTPLSQSGLAQKAEVVNRTFVGLDFGTSISVVSAVYFEGDKIEVRSIPVEQKGTNQKVVYSPLVPSCFGKSGKQFMLGQYARDMQADLTYGRDIWYGFKEALGTLTNTQYPDSELRNNTKARVQDARDGLVVFLRQLNAAVSNKINEQGLAKELCYVVSIPANYPAAKRAELRDCLEEAGIPYQDLPFIQEPVSALISAVYREDVNLGINEKNLIVVDLGAGTVDVSVMRITRDTDNINSELLSVKRLEDIGGNTINQMMAEHILKQTKLSDTEYKRFLTHLERSKIDLCKRIDTDQHVDYELPNLALSNETVNVGTGGIIALTDASISFKSFNAIMEVYWPKVFETINQSLADTNLDKGLIDDIIISGGGARNPYIKHFCHRQFPEANLVIPDDIQEQVAMGNALQALTFFAFGKNIINSRLYSDVYLNTSLGNTRIFKNNEIAPTFEFQAGIEAIVDNSIKVSFGEGLTETAEFRVPEGSTPEKVFIWVSADLDIQCSILLENEELQLAAHYT